MKKWSKISKIITMSALVTTLGLSVVGCGNSEDSTSEQANEDLKLVRIAGPGVDSNGNVTLPGGAQLAKIQGYLDEELEAAGYKAEYTGFQNGGVGVNEALASGEADIAVYGDFPAVTYVANGNDATIFAISSSRNQLGIFAKDDIKSVKDLKGKKVATLIGTNAYYYLEKELQENGIGINDVEIVNASTDTISLYSSDEVDAICNAPQSFWPLEAQKAGHVIAVNGDSDELSTSQVVLGRTEFVEKNPEVKNAIIKALEKTKTWANENEDEVYELLAELSGGNYTKENYEDYYSFEEGFEDMTPYVQDKDIEHLQSVADFMFENQYAKSKVDISESIDNSIKGQ